MRSASSIPTPHGRKALASLCAVCIAVLSGCATPPPAPAPTPTPPPAEAPAPVPAAPAPEPAPPAPAVPELSPAQAKAQAQKLAIEAVDQLQNGDENAAKATLDQALALDANHELARKLREQIGADAEKELGTVFFRYTVQRDDSLSKLAQQYLGDRFRFWILARYNDIPNPSRLAAGQVIKIPGKGPVAPAPVARPAGAAGEGTAQPRAEPEPATAPAAAPASEVTALMQKGAQMQRQGNLEGAFTAYSEAAQRAPGNRQAVEQREALRKALVARYDREASAAFQRQNLDLAIARWNRVLELDPNNQKAKLERDRAADLKKRLEERFGTK